MDELDLESGSKKLQISSSPLNLLLALKLNGTLLYLNAILVVSNLNLTTQHVYNQILNVAFTHLSLR